MNIKSYLEERRLQIESTLKQVLPRPEGLLADHINAVRYSVFAGGKRVRPILAMATAEALERNPEPYLPLITSLELIHTYALIHDDLPAMDDDDLRRGKPTNHKVFGEAAAILAGDSLVSYAFELLSDPEIAVDLPDSSRMKILHTVSRAIGPRGMVGGQALDIAYEDRKIPLETLRFLHSCKTGALIRSSVQTGAIIGKAGPQQFQALTNYADHIGLTFQIVDDLLDVEGNTEKLGKSTGGDLARKKSTYPEHLGIEETHKKARDTVEKALEALESFGRQGDPLREIARFIYYRDN
ncbi:MAG: polyprenyl synthetase family protein [Thermodesulfobacteriota bacterium]